MKLRHFLFFAVAGLAIGLSSCVSEAELARKAVEAERERKKEAWIGAVIKDANYLRKYVSGNSEQSEDKRNQGNALLEAFADEYLPNYSARYKAARLAALEKQEGYCDLLDALKREKVDLLKNSVFLSSIDKYYDVSQKYFDLRNKLIDLYAQHKIGVLSSDDLASVDSKFATSSRK